MKNFFKKIWQFLKKTWVLSLFITLLLCLFVWFAGPYFAIGSNYFWSSVISRLITICILFFLWGLFIVFIFSRGRKKEEEDPEKFAAKRARQEQRRQFNEETATLRNKLRDALKVVRKSQYYGKERRSRYTLPWYLLLGDKNSGKTSLIANSGLLFPINDKLGQQVSADVSTKDCDYFFGNHAIFMDTAGHYTMAEPESETEAIWHKFLRTLFRHRPARPLNGVIVCLSLRDFLENDANWLEHQARILRKRISELHQKLRISVPVYLVLTKCDVLPGFVDFFSQLPKAAREHPFGATFTADILTPEAIAKDLKDLINVLHAQVISKLHAERNISSRGEILAFPQAVADLAERLPDFIFQAFAASRYHKQALFRGFYFTSSLSMQEVMDSANSSLSQDIYHAPKTLLSGINKGHFILRTLTEIIFPEANNVQTDKKFAWHMRLRHNTLQVAALGVFISMLTVWAISFSNNNDKLDRLSILHTRFTEQKENIGQQDDEQQILSALNSMKEATEVYNLEEDSFFTLRMGLYQGKEAFHVTHEGYVQQLRLLLLPRIKRALEREMRVAMNKPVVLKEALRAYLMLNLPERLNTNFEADWLARLWADKYPESPEDRELLVSHFSYLLENTTLSTDLDAGLVKQARAVLLRQTPAEMAYQALKEESARDSIPPFTFRRAFGQSLKIFTGDDYPIPSLYTKEKYNHFFKKRGLEIVNLIMADSWIYGEGALKLNSFDLPTVYRDMRALYLKDYARHWTAALQSLKVRTSGDLAIAKEYMGDMAVGHSPVVLILQKVREETTFIQPDSAGENAATSAVATQAKRRIKGGALARAGTQAAGAALKKRLAEEQKAELQLQSLFEDLHVLLDDSGIAQPLLAGINQEIVKLEEFLGEINNAGDVARSAYDAAVLMARKKAGPFPALHTAAEKLPSPVSRWYKDLMNSSLDSVLSQAAQHIDSIYKRRVYSFYKEFLRRNYPFSKDSTTSVSIGDFSDFFAPEGILSSFHAKYLQPFEAGNRRDYRVLGQRIPLSSRAITEFNNAAEIQKAFFNGQKTPAVEFTLEPYYLDASLKQITLHYADKTFVYQHGPVVRKKIVWPPEQKSVSGTLSSFTAVDISGREFHTEASGAWSLFKLFQGASTQKIKGRQAYTMAITLGGRRGEFIIRPTSRKNPFSSPVYAFSLRKSLR